MSRMKKLVDRIGQMYFDGCSVLAIARQLNLSTTEVNHVINHYL